MFVRRALCLTAESDELKLSEGAADKRLPHNENIAEPCRLDPAACEERDAVDDPERVEDDDCHRGPARNRLAVCSDVDEAGKEDEQQACVENEIFRQAEQRSEERGAMRPQP